MQLSARRSALAFIVFAWMEASSTIALADEPPAPAPAAQQAAPQAPIEEVRVTGKRDPPAPAENRMSRSEIRSLPGAFGDPFRAIDVTPGLVPTLSGVPYYFIRGAPPSAVGYYVDEVRVPYLFHFALGPGVIHPVVIDEVSVYSAAFPGRYGRFSGGIVAGKTREPTTERAHGEAQLRLFDASAYAEAPFAQGRGYAGVGGRYSYTAALVSLLAPNITIDYRDYNARAAYQLDDRWRASTFIFGAFDYASERKSAGPGEAERESVFFASEFHRMDVRLDRAGDHGADTTRIAATVGFDRTRLEATRFAQDVVAGIRGRHRVYVDRHRKVAAEIGADVFADFYSADLPNPYAVSVDDYQRATAFFSPRQETASGLWTSVVWQPERGWNLTGTMRADLFTSDGRVAVGPSPRVSVRVPIPISTMAEKVAFIGALGVAPQPPAFAFPLPAVGYRGLPGGLSYGYQKSSGVEIALPFRFTLRTVGFHHSYMNLRSLSRQNNGGPDVPQPPPVSPAQAYGLELFLSRRMSQRFSAFVSTTISRSEEGSTSTHAARASEWDRTYVVQVGGVVDLGRNWRASSRFLTYGGWPHYPAGEQEGSFGGGGGAASAIRAANTPGDRLPGFSRLDVRLEKRWIFQKERWLAFVIEALNATASKETIDRQCFAPNQRRPGDPGGCVDETFGPILVPSIGLEGGL